MAVEDTVLTALGRTEKAPAVEEQRAAAEMRATAENFIMLWMCVIEWICSRIVGSRVVR